MEYPTMLYKGGLDIHAVAKDEDAADKLKANGYITHDEAMRIKPEDKPTNDSLLTDVGEQLGEAYEHIERLENELEDAKQVINDKIARIASLENIVAVYEVTKDKNGNGKVDYEEMTNKELQSLLDGRKVEYSKRDGKDALIKAAQDSES